MGPQKASGNSARERTRRLAEAPLHSGVDTEKQTRETVLAANDGPTMIYVRSDLDLAPGSALPTFGRRFDLREGSPLMPGSLKESLRYATTLIGNKARAQSYELRGSPATECRSHELHRRRLLNVRQTMPFRHSEQWQHVDSPRYLQQPESVNIGQASNGHRSSPVLHRGKGHHENVTAIGKTVPNAA